MGEYADNRGRIEDILVRPLTAVTRITTVKGATRGNHVHHHTTQWVYILSGKLQAVWPTFGVDGEELAKRILEPGDLHEEPAGVPHAWRALADTDCLVFTDGPRAGEDYEKDTERLSVPLL